MIRLYDKWASNIKITIQFKKPSEICAKKDEKTHNSNTNMHFDEIDGKQKDETAGFFTSYKVPDCGYTIYEKYWVKSRDYYYNPNLEYWLTIKLTSYRHHFIAWTFGASSQTYTKDTIVWIDESILALCKSNGNNSYTLEATGNFQKEAS